MIYITCLLKSMRMIILLINGGSKMQSIEKEVRYRVTRQVVEKIKEVSTILEVSQHQVDVTLGYDGFNSLQKYGYVCRVRQKGNRIWMEVKNRKDSETFYETKINLDDFAKGIEFFTALGMMPYLYMDRTREIFEYEGLKIFIDDVELLGLFVEIEYQDVDDSLKKLEEFLKKVGITAKEEPLYGDIFKKKLEEEVSFKMKFEEKLNHFLSHLR